MKALALAFSLLLAAPALAGEPVTLRPVTVVERDTVRLADIWDNLGAKGETPIARSPEPGRKVELDARWLSNVAGAYGIDWRPGSGFERITVERRAATIGRDRIETALLAALASDGVGANAQIEFLGGQDPELFVPPEAAARLAVRDLSFDARSRRFAATVEAGDSRVRLAGRVFSSVDVPVLVRNVARGEEIGPGDIEWRTMRQEQLPRDAIAETGQVVGLVARSSLRPGVPLRAGDVQRPIMVQKGAVVLMTLKLGSMSLTAQGRAAEPGGTGDMIRVTNINSKLTVEARVDGPNQVSVVPVNRALAN